MPGSAGIFRFLASITSAACLAAFLSAPAAAHIAPSGWAFPYQCCSDRNCQPVHDPAITEGPDGYVVGESGEIIGYADPRLKDSPDGEFHLCRAPGKPRSRAICLSFRHVCSRGRPRFLRSPPCSVLRATGLPWFDHISLRVRQLHCSGLDGVE
jgi:hypothetical protein